VQLSSRKLNYSPLDFARILTAISFSLEKSIEAALVVKFSSAIVLKRAATSSVSVGTDLIAIAIKISDQVAKEIIEDKKGELATVTLIEPLL